MSAERDVQKMAFAEEHSRRLQARASRIPSLPTTYSLDDKQRRKLESLARSYKPNPQMDVLEAMKRDQPGQYAKVSPGLKMSLAGYIAAREAAEQVGE